MRHMYRVAVALSIAVSAAAVCWWAYNFVGWSLEGAFGPVLHARRTPNANALILLWTACAGLMLTLTWEVISRYRQYKRGNSK